MAKNTAIAVTSIIAGVILIIALLALFVFRPVSGSSGNTVTVQGVSDIKVMPDLVTVYFNIETKGATSANATEENNKIYDDLIEQMVIAGFTKDDVKTESFSVYPNTYWDPTSGKSKTEGYVANHYLKVELPSDKISNVSTVVDAGVTAGAGISTINFELTQKAQNEYKAQALKQASQDAMVKADSIASGFGKSAGKLVSVQTSDFNYYPWNVYTAASAGGAYRTEDVAMAKAAATNIQPGEQDITATITATFKLR